ncbi:MAG: ATP-binding protein [Candidatus Omnitrophota bacterium]
MDKNKRFFKGGIRRKNIILIYLITLVIVFITSFLNFFQSSSLLKNSVAENHRKMALIVAEYTAKTIDDYVNQIESYTDSIYWKQDIVKKNERYQNMRPEEIYVYLKDLEKQWQSGQEKTGLNGDFLIDSKLNKRLKRLVKKESHITQIIITDKYGGLAACSCGQGKLYFRDELWWKKAFNEGKGSVYLQDMVYDKENDTWNMFISLPMRDDNNNIIGISRFAYGLDTFFSIVGELRIKNTGHIAVVNKDGYIIFHQGIKPLTVKYCSEENYKKLLNSRTKTAILFFPYHKEKMFVAYAEVKEKLLSETGAIWTVFISQESKEVFAPVSGALFLQTIVIIILLLIVAFPLEYIFSSMFVKPVEELHNMALKIKEGDFSQRVYLNTKDELQELGDTFNSMIDSIKQKQEELEKYALDLERSNKDLEQFAYVASHDLREPLRMITSYLQLIEKNYKGRLGKDADEFIGYATDGAINIRNLIDDLLIYSRVGTHIEKFKQVDCEEVLNQAVINLKLVIEENSALISHDQLPIVMADHTQLVQLFQNLIDNAIKFRGKEAPRIHISCQGDNSNWVFSVKDNGIGIEPMYFIRIFQIFQRLHPRREYQGTGIGLAVCKRIVERHNGKIWVESEPRKGSNFFFTIPLKEGITITWPSKIKI